MADNAQLKLKEQLVRNELSLTDAHADRNNCDFCV